MRPLTETRPDNDTLAEANRQALRMLDNVLRRRRPRRVLAIKAPGASGELFDRPAICWPPSTQTVVVDTRDGTRRLRCRSHDLPFVNEAFDLVVLLHVVQDGGEPELAEAKRVLAGGGELLVVGWNRWGWGVHSRNNACWPGMAGGAIQHRLGELGLVVERRLGCGLGGRPASWLHPPPGQALLQPVADLHLWHCRHERGTPGATVVRFSTPRPQPGQAPVASAGRVVARRQIGPNDAA